MEQTIFQKLHDKVMEMVERHHALKQEIDRLHEETEALRASDAQKDAEIARLKEENGMKDLEIEEIVNKIESILG